MSKSTGTPYLSMFFIAAIFLLAGLSLGYILFQTSPPIPEKTTITASQNEPEETIWTCSMHPNIRMPEPGRCPICAMELIPIVLDTADQEAQPSTLSLSKNAMALAEVETVPVEHRFVETVIRLFGKLQYDETRVKHISAWTSGRVDRMYVDYTGVPVRKGDHLVYLYSPDLLTAQEELLQTLKSTRRLQGSSSDIVREASVLNVQAAREKLLLLGLSETQLKRIEEERKVSDHLTIYSPVGGIVVEKWIAEGSYVETGKRIYTVADLSQLWLQLDAYESDLMWVRYGQPVRFETEAYPGEIFEGKVAFIAPVLNDNTRTVQVRVNVPNPDGRLKPGMFARAQIHVRIAAEGSINAPDLSGKWMCPMHPEVLKDKPGTCDLCRMPLVTATQLGYVSEEEGNLKKPLVVPISAVLNTGKRAIVYRALPDVSGQFEAREVLLGPRAAEDYLVYAGLQEGDRVVRKGAFKIDSAMQIQAQPSMMQLADAEGASEEGLSKESLSSSHKSSAKPGLSDAETALIDEILRQYFSLQKALSKDDLGKSQQLVKSMEEWLGGEWGTNEKHAQPIVWKKIQSDMREALGVLKEQNSIEDIRKGFALISDVLHEFLLKTGSANTAPVYRFQCPMAFNNRGAFWLQQSEQTENPYFGASMYRCGGRVNTLTPKKEEEKEKKKTPSMEDHQNH